MLQKMRNARLLGCFVKRSRADVDHDRHGRVARHRNGYDAHAVCKSGFLEVHESSVYKKNNLGHFKMKGLHILDIIVGYLKVRRKSPFNATIKQAHNLKRIETLI